MSWFHRMLLFRSMANCTFWPFPRGRQRRTLPSPSVSARKIFLLIFRPAANVGSSTRRQYCFCDMNRRKVFLSVNLMSESASCAMPHTHLILVFASFAFSIAKLSSYPALESRSPCNAERLLVAASKIPLESKTNAPGTVATC